MPDNKKKLIIVPSRILIGKLYSSDIVIDTIMENKSTQYLYCENEYFVNSAIRKHKLSIGKGIISNDKIMPVVTPASIVPKIKSPTLTK